LFLWLFISSALSQPGFVSVKVGGMQAVFDDVKKNYLTLGNKAKG
jgi:hypothetical protein